MSKKRIEADNPIMESSTTFNLLEEHPSHKYMVMSRRKNIYVSCISSINLLPNIADLDIGNITTDATILKQREEYAKIVLLLFYPYRIQNDLMMMGSYRDKYESVLKEKVISAKSLEVFQNIKDVSHNCVRLKVARDDLVKSTTMIAHDDDRKCQQKDSENTIYFDEVADMLQQLDDFGVREVHPTQSSINTIASRVNILPLNIPESESPLSNIADIPEGVTLFCGLPTTNKTRATANDVIYDVFNPQKNNNLIGCHMIIDILNGVVLKGLPMTPINPQDL